MKRIIDKLRSIFKYKQEIIPDGRYMVCDIKHDNFSPERLLYERKYLRKFNPEIMEIDGNMKLTIIIDSEFDFIVLSNYIYDENDLAMVDMVDDNNIDSKISGYIVIG